MARGIDGKDGSTILGWEGISNDDSSFWNGYKEAEKIDDECECIFDNSVVGDEYLVMIGIPQSLWSRIRCSMIE